MSMITDEEYQKLSDHSYEGLPVGEKLDGKVSGWEVIDSVGESGASYISGFDATVYQNKQTDQIVIAYRGTDDLPDYGTDAADVVGGRYKYLQEQVEGGWSWWDYTPMGIGSQVSNEIQYKMNPFYQAEELYTKVRDQYPNANISLTGHSLGGAEAQLVAAKYDVNAVTFSAPSVMNLLTDDVEKKAKNGQFDNQIINYVNPRDSIGAGALSEYDRHVGSTYYINEDYATANALYDSLPPDMQLSGKIVKFGFSIMGEDYNYHNMKHYQFDEDGNISNKLVNRLTGEILTESPRKTLYEQSQLAMAKLGALASGLLGKWIGSIGNADKTIEVRPEQLKQVASTMQRSAEQFQMQSHTLISRVQTLMATSRSHRLTSITQRTHADLQQITLQYLQRTKAIADYIDKKANDFATADNTTTH